MMNKFNTLFAALTVSLFLLIGGCSSTTNDTALEESAPVVEKLEAIDSSDSIAVESESADPATNETATMGMSVESAREKSAAPAGAERKQMERGLILQDQDRNENDDMGRLE